MRQTVPNLPDAPETEALVLGVLLTDPDALEPILSLGTEDFSLDAHRRIYNAVRWLHENGEQIDRVTVATRLQSQRELESVGGLSYLVGLDTNCPRVYGLESYIGTLRVKSTLRRAAIAAYELSERLCMPGAEVEEIRIAEEFLRDLAAYAERKPASLMDLGEHLEQIGIEDFINPSRVKGIPTPWGGLNDLLTGGGFRAGQLVIVAGRPGMGKSTVAALIALAAAEWRPAVFSLEMGATENWHRMIASLAKIPYKALSEGKLAQDERLLAIEAMTWLASSGITLDETTGANVPAIIAATKKRKGIGMVIVDYLQLLSPVRKRGNRTEETSEISRSLKLAARALRMPFVVLSQLTRANAQEDRPPELHDLRDSGSIESDADMVMFLHASPKEITNAIAERRPSHMDLLLKKQRNGPTGRIPLIFSARTMQITEQGRSEI